VANVTTASLLLSQPLKIKCKYMYYLLVYWHKTMYI